MMTSSFSYNGLWKCTSCGTDELINTQLFCPNCGTPIPLKVNGYPDTRKPEESKIPQYIIRDQRLLERISRKEGVWECRFCEGVHPDEENFCDKCGASKDGDAPKQPEVYTESPTTYVPVYDRATLPDSSGQEGSTDLWTPAQNSYPISKAVPIHFGFDLKRVAIGIVVIALLGLVSTWAYREFVVRTTFPAEIQSVSWYRSMPVEVYRWIDESNQTGCPSGNRNCTSAREVVGQERYKSGSHQEPIYSSRTIADGETCSDNQNPDGSYTRSCTTNYTTETYISGHQTVDDYSYRDVYGTVFRYQIQRWVFSRNLPTSGNDWDPYWETDYRLGTEYGELERLAGNNTENYTIVLVTEDGRTHHWNSANETEWHEFQNGETSFEVILNGNGGLVSAGRHIIAEE